MSLDVRASATVPVAPDRAFSAFAEELGAWWPPEYTWSQGTLESIGIAPPAEGGLCTEIGPHGFRCDWGRVLVWEPGARLVLAWQIAPSRAPEPDPSRASEVSITFSGAGDGTQVSLVHGAFERHGEGAEEYAAGMGSPQGWDYILARYAAHAGAS